MIEIIEHIFLIFHLAGLSILVSGFLPQFFGTERVNYKLLQIGAWTQIVTGIIMFGLMEMDKDKDLNYLKISLKILVALLVLVFIYISKIKNLSNQKHYVLLVLVIINIGIAVLM